MQEFSYFEAELANFYDVLPESHKFNQKNLFIRAFTPKRTSFVMLHIWWHQCYCQLYRLTLSGMREALPPEECRNLSPEFMAYCQEQCLRHATAAIDIIKSLTALDTDLWVSDPAFAVCAFHLARIVSRFARPDCSRLSQAGLSECLRVCSAGLQKPASIYPTAQLLLTGVEDMLYNSTQAATRSPSPDRADSSDRVHNGKVATAEPRTVYSKFSVMDEVQRLRFSDSEDDNLAAATSDSGNASLGHHTMQRSSGQTQQLGTEFDRFDRLMSREIGGSMDIAAGETPFSVSGFDVSALGFDFGYGAQNFDPYLDSDIIF
jgi:hypothetical protein